jgi:predicted alpha/beta superfamily hydrolase
VPDDEGLQRLSDDTWAAEVALAASCPAEGLAVRVAFVDPGAGRTYSCGANLCVSRSSEIVHLYPHFFARRGNLESIGSVASPQLAALPGALEDWKAGREISVFLPASYSENEAKPYTDLLVLHDGQKFSDETWPITIDALVLSGAIDELVVVCVPSPPNGDQRMAELTPLDGDGRRMPELLAALAGAASGTTAADPSDEGYALVDPGFFGHLDEYLSYVTDAVLPAVSKAFPRVVGGGRIGSAGSSMGGLASVGAVLTRPDVFNRGLCCAPSLWWGEGSTLAQVLPAALESGLAMASDLTVWLDTGSGEHKAGMQDTTEAMHVALAEAGMPPERLRFHLDEGGFHDFNGFWRRLQHALPFLFAPAAAAVAAAAAPSGRL